MVNVDALIQAFYLVFTFETMMWIAIGVTIGVGVGAMPGLTATTGVALMLPLTFTMGTAPALGLLIGLYKGAIYGGSISAISFATPGTSEAAATVFDGYKMMRTGKGRKALLMALYSSVTADFLSDVITILVAPMLALIALQFGPSERFWLMALAICLLGALSGPHLAKGMFSAALGLFIGTIGSDPISSVSRNTFDLWWLADGIHLIPLVIGIFAMGAMLERAVELLKESKQAREMREAMQQIFSTKGEGLTFKEYLSCWKEMGIGLGVGTFVGMLPGLGSTVGAFLSYSIAKQVSPHKKIGTGKLEGIAAAEAGNNATVGPTLVPLLAFGIPGSAVAALIGGALMLQGATPGPRMFELFPEVVYSLFIILLIGNIFNLGIGRVFAFIYSKLGELPAPILVPMVMVMAVIGSYSFENNPYDVLLMLGFGLMGFFMRKFKIPEAPLIITFLLTPVAEENIRRGLLINEGSWMDALFSSPLAIGLAIAVVLLTWLSTKARISERMQVVDEDEAEGTEFEKKK
ncbi:MAG: tripartite tricarboxylate transporter permease [Alphaproteobacteria bacterium]|jgi:putative tricarboxylic transport membrane protein